MADQLNDLIDRYTAELAKAAFPYYNAHQQADRDANDHGQASSILNRAMRAAWEASAVHHRQQVPTVNVNIPEELMQAWLRTLLNNELDRRGITSEKVTPQ